MNINNGICIDLQASTKPWLKIFTSGAVWAILLANACGNYGAYMIMTQIPTYMKDVLKFDIKSVSIFANRGRQLYC